MSWAGFGILFRKYPQLRGSIEKLQKYEKDISLQIGDILDPSHASAWTNNSETHLKEILERGVNLGIFQKVYRLKCSIRDGFVEERETPYSFPLEIFCDLCGKKHTFTEDDVVEGYRLKFIFSDEDIEQVESTMPILCYFAKKFSNEFRDRRPFHNKTFLIVLHFLKDLIIFLKTCEKLGLEPNKSHIFWKPYFYPYKEPIISHLKSEGYCVYPLEKLEDVLQKLDQSESSSNIIVMEDGGYIIPLLHKHFSNLLNRVVGAVEQTTRGIWNDNEIQNIAVPILNVAEADVKTRIEPPHVADAVVKNIEKLLSFETLRGRNVALMGYGTIGREIAERLKSKGMNIMVYDPKSEKRIEAGEKGYAISLEPYNAVKDKFIVIGCSGKTSIGRSEILNLAHNTYLVSATSDQKEIGLLELDALSNKKEPFKQDEKVIGTSYFIRGQKNKPIHLVADGYPINFWCAESMPNQVSDLILSIILSSTTEVVQNRKKYGNGIQSVNEIVENYEITKIYEEHYEFGKK